MTFNAAPPVPTSAEEIQRIRQVWLADRAGRDRGEGIVHRLREEIPFYRDVPASRLSDLPVVDRRLHAEDGARFRREGSASPYSLTTSGTTGPPLSVDFDGAAWYAVNYHFFRQIAAVSGLADADFTPAELAVLFVSNKPGRRSFVTPMPTLNNGLYARVRLGSPATAGAVYERFRAPILYGKPTYLLDLRAALLAQGVVRPPWSPRVLLTSGEPLYRDDRRRLTDYFGAPVVDALASTEGGLLAATRPGGETYEVFGDNVRLEVLAEDGAVRASGTGELVLTNLIYRDTVFVRYRTGDFAELRTGCDGSQRLLRLWGREPRWVRFRTGRVATDLLTERLGFLPGLADFQVVTGHGGAPVVRWVPDATHHDPRETQRGVRAVMEELLPREGTAIERCERITPPGGKKRRFR